MKKLILAAALATAAPAQATLIVSADSNIITFLNDNYTTHDAKNQRFFRNILNGSTNVVIRDSVLASSIDASYVTGYYSSIGIGTTLIGVNTAITAADLAGTGLYIDILPRQGYTAGEVSAIHDFLQTGGNFLVTGDNQYLANNSYVNAMLGSIGSSIVIHDACIACGFFDTAHTVGSSPLANGMSGIQIVASSYLTGGTALFNYGFQFGGDTVIATEGAARVDPGVPEPASWAMLIVGFGLTGAAMRRRRIAVAA